MKNSHEISLKKGKVRVEIVDFWSKKRNFCIWPGITEKREFENKREYVVEVKVRKEIKRGDLM